jgi:hypothetical protein
MSGAAWLADASAQASCGGIWRVRPDGPSSVHVPIDLTIERSMVMWISELRAELLGLLVVLLAGLYGSATAHAAGPFFHHRPLQGSGNGVKIDAREPEGVFSSAGEQKLRFKALDNEVEIASPHAEVKGVIYNNALQGQAKLLVTFLEPKITKPISEAECEVKIGTNNTLKLFGHQAWTWDGTKTQLEEQPQKEQKPDWIFLSQELQQGAEELPKTLFYTLTLSKGLKGTCAAAAVYPVIGNAAAAVEPLNLGEWSSKEGITLLEDGTKQHFWNGKKNIGVESFSSLGGEKEELVGQFKLNTTGRPGGAPQEIAHFES